MALIKCSECGREISTKAGACPHCGCPVSESIKPKTENQPKVEKEEPVEIEDSQDIVTPESTTVSPIQQPESNEKEKEVKNPKEGYFKLLLYWVFSLLASLGLVVLIVLAIINLTPEILEQNLGVFILAAENTTLIPNASTYTIIIILIGFLFESSHLKNNKLMVAISMICYISIGLNIGGLYASDITILQILMWLDLVLGIGLGILIFSKTEKPFRSVGRSFLILSIAQFLSCVYIFIILWRLERGESFDPSKDKFLYYCFVIYYYCCISIPFKMVKKYVKALLK